MYNYNLFQLNKYAFTVNIKKEMKQKSKDDEAPLPPTVGTLFTMTSALLPPSCPKSDTILTGEGRNSVLNFGNKMRTSPVKNVLPIYPGNFRVKLLPLHQGKDCSVPIG
jgi:hypothetical protein